MGQSLERVGGHRTGGTGMWFLCSYCHRQFSKVFMSVTKIRGGKLFCRSKFVSFALPFGTKMDQEEFARILRILSFESLFLQLRQIYIFPEWFLVPFAAIWRHHICTIYS